MTGENNNVETVSSLLDATGEAPETKRAVLGMLEWMEAHRAEGARCDDVNFVAKVLRSYLSNRDTCQKLEKESYLAGLVEKNQHTYNYIVENNSYKIIYIGEHLKECASHLKIGDICYEVFHNGKEPCESCPLRQELHNEVEKFNKWLGGWINAKATQVRMEDGRPARLITVTDISDFRRRLFFTDELTGIATFAKFEENVVRALENRTDEKYTFAYMDFENFKKVNERRGVETGNNVLRHFAEFLSANLEEGEFGCRYFADVFLVLFRGCSADDFRTRLEAMRQNMESWVEELGNDGLMLKCGIYPVPKDETDIMEIMTCADIARRSVKGGDPRICGVYDDEMRQKCAMEREFDSSIKRALENDEFVVYMQSKVDLKTDKVVGAEALIRWQRADDGIIPPAEFLPYLERNGYIKELDYYMCNHVFATLRQWMNEKKCVVPVSINISCVNIKKASFVANMKALIEKYNIPPHMVELELTEIMFVKGDGELIKTINALRSMGVQFSIDDFGKGYSSLNMIRSLPIDVLKLDKDFFDHVHISEKERIMLMHIVRLAKSLDMKVLCEGVETQDQLEYLKSVGCDLAQGYLFARPAPAEEFQKMLESSNV